MLKINLVVLFLLFSLSSSALVKSTLKISENAIQIWEGIGTQDDNSTWSIRFTIVGQQYFIDYPSLNCGGRLIPVSIDIKRYKFKEQLLYGKSRCLDDGQVTITKAATKKDSNSAKFSYSHPEGIATGTLIRQ